MKYHLPMNDLEKELAKLKQENADLKKRLNSRDDILIANAIPLLVSYVDRELRYTFVNKAYEKWFNVKIENLIGMSVREFVGEDVFNKAKPFFDRVLSGEKVEFQQESKYANGTRHINVNYIPDVDPVSGAVRGIIALVDDISDRVQLEKLQRKELEETHLLNQKLIEEREIRERFVSALTHDLRTPLTAAGLSAQILAKKIDDPVIKHRLSRIKFNMDRADRMIQDLLDANRLKTGETIALRIDAFSLNDMIELIIHNANDISERKVIFESNGKELNGHWDRNGIERIIENLIGNAFKYGSPDTPVSIIADEKKDMVSITVHNHGNPISPEEQKTLFTPYHRLHSAKMGIHKGWGIGLTLVKGIANAHGGSIEVESSLEKGTSFIVWLPKDATQN